MPCDVPSAPTGKSDNYALPEAFSESEQLLTGFFGASSVGFAIFDRELRFQAINKVLADMNGVPAEAHLGKTVAELLGEAGRRIESEFKRVLETRKPVLNVDLTLHLPTRTEQGHWNESYFPIMDSSGQVKQIGVVVVEVTDRKKLEKSVHTLNHKLLRTQHDEQRRIARDLHDSVSQYHAAMKMCLAALAHDGVSPTRQRRALNEAIQLLEDCISETRTISHLLHPPLLDQMGFVEAARCYVRGFGERSGIRVHLDVPAELEGLSGPIEIALFRVLQEALTNVHRHARTATVDVEVRRSNGCIALKVRDHGCGIVPRKLKEIREQARVAGVGIAGMYERVQELGGEMELKSNGHGTVLDVTIPVGTSEAEGRASGLLTKGRSA